MRSPKVLGSAVAAAVAAALSMSAGAAAQAPAGDQTTGSGGTEFFSQFSFFVSSGPSGENPTGSSSLFVSGFGPFALTGIDCLSVSGRTATFAGPLAPNGNGYTHGKTTVVDGGPGGAGDTYISAGFFSPVDCSPYPGGQPLTTGDIVVHDAQPAPTTKEQCKGEPGYRAFGFKNQGQCIAAVQRPAKP
jgi:hypothetical protein